MLRKSDFLANQKLKNPLLKNEAVKLAVDRTELGFADYNLLSVTSIKNKSVYRVTSISDELILRKINRNLNKAISLPPPNRDSIIANIKNLLSEGVNYNVYRLDIKSFYESFNHEEVISKIGTLKKLSPLTKKMVADILRSHVAGGGVGVPRGLALSATFSEILMLDVDKEILQNPDVFFYARYVDDIIVISSGNEDPKSFTKDFSKILPKGLILNKNKETFCSAPDSKPQKVGYLSVSSTLSFEFLGYKFSVYEPLDNKKPSAQFRDVVLDIADSKVRKIKTRITKSILSYCTSMDFDLLELRIKFLTSNFSVLDINRDSHRLAGIYHNYHRIDPKQSVALLELDRYLKKAALSSYGNIFNDFFCKTTVVQRRRILTFSFLKGFEERTFMHFSRSQLKIIQECWKYA